MARDAGGRLTIEDLGSANGTFVNGERVPGRRVLELGDLVQIGSTSLQLTRAGQAPRPSVPPPAPAAAPVQIPRAPAAPAVNREGLISELPRGSVFAGCRVEEVISHGDMAVVYRAEDGLCHHDAPRRHRYCAR